MKIAVLAVWELMPELVPLVERGLVEPQAVVWRELEQLEQKPWYWRARRLSFEL